jgi:ferrochelatase
VHTEKQSILLRGWLGERGHEVQVAYAMRYGNPSVPSVLARLKKEGCDRVLILPAYPQYSAAATASVQDAVATYYKGVRNIPELRFVKHYHDHESYIAALRQSVLRHWEMNGRPDRLVMSFHGIPKRSLHLGDPYHCECHKTARLLAAQLGLNEGEYVVSFQSRFGKAEWLQPYTAPTLAKLAREGVRRVDVMCPGFVADCLETLEEIGIEGRQAFLTAGGKEYHLIPCLNEAPEWIEALAKIAEQHMSGWPTILSPGERQAREKAMELSKVRATTFGAPQ